MFQKSADSEMAGFQMVPLQFPGIFLNYVWKYGIQYISCSKKNCYLTDTMFMVIPETLQKSTVLSKLEAGKQFGGSVLLSQSYLKTNPTLN